MVGEEFGINSFKVFMAYKDVMMLEDDEIIECFKVHCSAVQYVKVQNTENLVHLKYQPIGGQSKLYTVQYAYRQNVTVHQTKKPFLLLYSTELRITVQYSTVQCSAVQYSTVQYSTVHCSTVQYSTDTYECFSVKSCLFLIFLNFITSETKFKSVN